MHGSVEDGSHGLLTALEPLGMFLAQQREDVPPVRPPLHELPHRAPCAGQQRREHFVLGLSVEGRRVLDDVVGRIGVE